MTKFERILNASRGLEVDAIPTGFWFHFPEESFYGDAAVEAHLALYKEIDTDIFKIMNENKYRNSIRPTTISDWDQWNPIKVRGSHYEDSLDTIKKVSDAIGDEVPLLFTIHGVYVSAFHGTFDSLSENYADVNNMISTHFREKPEIFRSAFQTVGETVLELSLEAIKAGAHGIYYAALGAEKHRFPEGLYEEYIKPVELEILSEIQKHTDYLVLHICKDNVRMPIFKDYPSNFVNWAIYENDFTLEQGRELFKKSLLGGFDDRSGLLTGTDLIAIEDETKKIIDSEKGKGLILGSDCTLPTEVDLENVRMVVKTARNYRS